MIRQRIIGCKVKGIIHIFHCQFFTVRPVHIVIQFNPHRHIIFFACAVIIFYCLIVIRSLKCLILCQRLPFQIHIAPAFCCQWRIRAAVRVIWKQCIVNHAGNGRRNTLPRQPRHKRSRKRRSHVSCIQGRWRILPALRNRGVRAPAK